VRLFTQRASQAQPDFAIKSAAEAAAIVSICYPFWNAPLDDPQHALNACGLDGISLALELWSDWPVAWTVTIVRMSAMDDMSMGLGSLGPFVVAWTVMMAAMMFHRRCHLCSSSLEMRSVAAVGASRPLSSA
jgi:hypothetical protein